MITFYFGAPDNFHFQHLCRTFILSALEKNTSLCRQIVNHNTQFIENNTVRKLLLHT